MKTIDLPPSFFHPWPTGKPTTPPPVRGGTTEQWLAVAARIEAGGFTGADESTIEAAFIGLRRMKQPEVIRAIALLVKEPKCPARVRKKMPEFEDLDEAPGFFISQL